MVWTQAGRSLLSRRSALSSFAIEGDGSGKGVGTADQVRFYGPTGLLRLDDISPITFSEIMRDVDTFVAVANIGSDPDWYIYQAGQTYWQQYAFGDLSQGAENRRAVLKRVLPMLKIANRCEVNGKFLAVKGDLHDYKIHLGSTNVLMEPGSRFLCIQPDGDKPALPRTIFLPFEGDRGLAVILSKALLLAHDKEIKDQLILDQIRRCGANG